MAQHVFNVNDKAKCLVATVRGSTVKKSAEGFTQQDLNDIAASKGITNFIALDADTGRALEEKDLCPKYKGNVEIREVNSTKA